MNPIRRRRLGQAAKANAVAFAGTPAQWLAITDGAQTGLNPGVSDFSFAYWLFPTGASALASVVGKGATSDPLAPGYWNFYNTNGKFSFLMSDATTTRLNFQTTGAALVGQWTHVVASYTRASTMTVYLNGVAETPFTISTRAGSMVPTADFALASSSPNGAHAAGGSPLSGRMDMVGFWSRALSAGDVAALYVGGNGVAFAQLSAALLTNLVSWWDFNGVFTDAMGVNNLTPSAARPTFGPGVG